MFLSSMQLSHTLPTLKPRLTYLFFLFLRIRGGRTYVRYRKGRWRRLRRLVRRMKIIIRGRARWIYPKAGRLVVNYRRKGRVLRFLRGRPRLYYRKKWIKFGRRKTLVKLRLRLGGRWRYVIRRRGRWTIRYMRKIRRVILRGRRFGVRFRGRWRYVPSRGGTLQIRYGKIWRRVRNCCNKLRAVLRGRLRRIQLRRGRARMRGRYGWRKIRRKTSKFRLRRVRGQF